MHTPPRRLAAALLVALAGSFQHATPPLRRSQRDLAASRRSQTLRAAQLEVTEQYGLVDEPGRDITSEPREHGLPIAPDDLIARANDYYQKPEPPGPGRF